MSTKADRTYAERVYALPPARRAALAFELYDFARNIARTAILREEPGLNEIEIAQRLFVRFYGDDLPPERVADIVARIGRGELGPGYVARREAERAVSSPDGPDGRGDRGPAPAGQDSAART